jgi:hypothetical protein
MVVAALGTFAAKTVASFIGLPALLIESASALIFVAILVVMIRGGPLLSVQTESSFLFDE